MSTTTAAVRNTIDVKLVHLISLYAIIPIILLAVWIDQTWLSQWLLFSVPFRPEYWLVWVYLFGMPHVIGGVQMFADTEYLKTYGWRLFRIFIVCLALPLVVVPFFGNQVMFMIFMMFIVYHTVAQQLGLTLVALKRAPDFFFYVLKWTAIGVSGVLYLMLYFQPFPIVLFDYGWRDPLMIIGQILLAAVVFAGGVVAWKNRTNRLGVVYVLANVALILAECYLFYMHYYLFVVVMGRIIHEFTAWPIYAAHDHNRNLAGPNNWLFRLFKGRVPTAILSISFAFLIGFAVMYTMSSITFLTSVLVSLSIYHYYTEHFLWRRDSLLRMHVNFVR